jgi:hypothetical protein
MPFLENMRPSHRTERDQYFIPEKNNTCITLLQKVIKINILETGCEGVNWTELVQNSVQWHASEKALMNIWVP